VPPLIVPALMVRCDAAGAKAEAAGLEPRGLASGPARRALCRLDIVRIWELRLYLRAIPLVKPLILGGYASLSGTPVNIVTCFFA
jgi:hypothetical protein